MPTELDTVTYEGRRFEGGGRNKAYFRFPGFTFAVKGGRLAGFHQALPPRTAVEFDLDSDEGEVVEKEFLSDGSNLFVPDPDPELVGRLDFYAIDGKKFKYETQGEVGNPSYSDGDEKAYVFSNGSDTVVIRESDVEDQVGDRIIPMWCVWRRPRN